MTKEQIEFFNKAENAYQCDFCPENKRDPDYQAGGRLPCGQWQCWVVLKSETWRRGKK